MNIVLEYMQRTGTIRNFLSFPFSLFLYHKDDLQKLIVVVNKCQHSGKLVSKHWHLDHCQENQCLPSMDEYPCNDIFNDKHIILPKFNLIDLPPYQSPIKSNFKYHNSPNEVQLYLRDSDRYLNDFDIYNQKKSRWLWNKFLEIYLPEIVILGLRIKRSLGLYNSEMLIMQEQLSIVEQEFPTIWKYWNLWKKHFLNIQGIPAELAYRNLYQKMNLS